MLTMENVTALRMRRHCLTRHAGAAEYDALYRDLSPGLNVHWHGFGQPPCLVEARRYGREKYMGARSGFGCRTNAGELFRAGRGTGSFGEQPKPRVAARTDVFRLSFRPMSGFGHAASRNGRKQTPGRDSPCAKVQAQDSESPFTHVRDCRGKPTA